VAMSNKIVFDLNRISRAEFAALTPQENGRLSDEDTATLVATVVTSWPYDEEISEEGFFDLPLIESRVVEDKLTEAIQNIQADGRIRVDLNRATRRQFRAVTAGDDGMAGADFMAKVVVEWPYGSEISPDAFMRLGLADSKAVEATVIATLQDMATKRLGKQSTSARKSVQLD
jgi:hypothetical protein